ncbi:hypothetical protein VTN02DRAFT_3395 [Thermoascus thermophilus]
MTVSHTPEQNRSIEQAGGVLPKKARAMFIHSRLPMDLCPEALRTTAWLANRTPIRVLNWTTPFERVRSTLGDVRTRPGLLNIRVHSCRTYIRDPQIPRKEKMKARAKIGYLVGYKVSNIWRVWLPREQRVVDTRDMIFNEKRFFDINEPFLEDMLVSGIGMMDERGEEIRQKAQLQGSPDEHKEEIDHSLDPSSSSYPGSPRSFEPSQHRQEGQIKQSEILRYRILPRRKTRGNQFLTH